jgi:hypothetical protein
MSRRRLCLSRSPVPASCNSRSFRDISSNRCASSCSHSSSPARPTHRIPFAILSQFFRPSANLKLPTTRKSLQHVRTCPKIIPCNLSSPIRIDITGLFTMYESVNAKDPSSRGIIGIFSWTFLHPFQCDPFLLVCSTRPLT